MIRRPLLLTALVAGVVALVSMPLLAQLPGPPVGAPQSVQSASYGYNFQFPFTPNVAAGVGVRIAPTLNLMVATSQTPYLMDVGGTIVFPNSTASGTTAAAMHVGTVVCTLNSATLTNCANLVVEAEPATGTNKYGFWSKGKAQFDGAVTMASTSSQTTVTATAVTNQFIIGTTTTDTLNFAAPSVSRVITFADPGGADSVAYLAASQALSNKTIPTSGVGFTNATSGTVTMAAPTGALGTPTVTIPAITTALSGSLSCGNALAAAGTCGNTAQAGTFKVLVGTYVLGSNSSAVTGISPAFTSSTSWNCVANDITTRANVVQAIPQSASAFTITNTTGASDTISVICAGN